MCLEQTNFKDFQMLDGHRNAFCPFSRFFEDQLHF